jgi:hypothetical protein
VVLQVTRSTWNPVWLRQPVWTATLSNWATEIPSSCPLSKIHCCSAEDGLQPATATPVPGRSARQAPVDSFWNLTAPSGSEVMLHSSFAAPMQEVSQPGENDYAENAAEHFPHERIVPSSCLSTQAG